LGIDEPLGARQAPGSSLSSLSWSLLCELHEQSGFGLTDPAAMNLYRVTSGHVSAQWYEGTISCALTDEEFCSVLQAPGSSLSLSWSLLCELHEQSGFGLTDPAAMRAVLENASKTLAADE
jgi:hypothetical protein